VPSVEEMDEGADRQPRVLWVDAEPERGRRYAEWISDDGVAVETTTSTTTALARIEGNGVDCAIVHDDFEERTGHWLLGAVESNGLETPVILVSESEKPSCATAAFRGGAADYVPLDGDPGADAGRVVDRLRAALSMGDGTDGAATVYERVTDAFVAFDTEWRYTYVNGRAERLLDRSREDLLGENAWETFPDLVGSEFEGALRGAMAEQDSRRAEDYIPSLDTWFEIRVFPSADGMSVFFRDVSERKRQEVALRRERDRTAALFTNTKDCIVYCEYEGDEPIVREVNPAFERTFGYAQEEVAGEHIDDVLTPTGDRERAEEINRRIRTGDQEENEVRRRTATGLRDFLLRSVPIGDPPVDAGYAVYTDITDRKEREQRLQVLTRVLRHNLRNDVNVVLGAAETALAALEEGRSDAALREQLNTILTAGDRLMERSEHAQEIEGTFARMSDDRVTVDVGGLLERHAETARSRYPVASVETRVDTDAAALVDPAFETAIEELLRNAVEHSDRAAPSVRLTADDCDGIVTVTVADDGPGVPEEERRVLLCGEETPLQHSDGLGLWLVNWVVRSSGGDLSLDDADPRGSRVTLRLPTADQDG